MLKLLHLADVHLDAPFRWLGAKGDGQRRQLKETFRAAIDLALKEQVDCLLIAGDLFDGNSPTQDTIDLVQHQLARLAAPVVILPGTHDCFDGASIYRRVDFSGPSGNVRVFDETHSAFQLGPNLTVHGKANLTKTSSRSPLQGLRANPDTRYNVALAHGSLAMPGAEQDFPISAGEIAGSDMRYIALGHWHAQRDCSAGPTKAFYSGPAELLGEGEVGSPLLVELADRETKVEGLPIAKRRFKKMILPLDGLANAEQLIERLRRERDPGLILAASLMGVKPLDLLVDASRLGQELAADFFALRVDDQSHPSLTPEQILALPEKTVIGEFARRMKDLVATAATPEELYLREAALQLGVALLRGKKVLE